MRSKVVTEAAEDTIRWSANVDADDMTWLRLTGAHHGGREPNATPAPDLKVNTCLNTMTSSIVTALCSMNILHLKISITTMVGTCH